MGFRRLLKTYWFAANRVA